MEVGTIGCVLINSFADAVFNRNRRKMDKGSRQRWILSPLLYHFYVKEGIEDIVNHDVGCKTGLKVKCIKNK